jgi:hypothetical protein
MDEVTLAQEMFQAYNDQGPNPWKTFDGRDVPRWPELSEQVQAKWRASAHKAKEILEVMTDEPQF